MRIVRFQTSSVTPAAVAVRAHRAHRRRAVSAGERCDPAAGTAYLRLQQDTPARPWPNDDVLAGANLLVYRERGCQRMSDKIYYGNKYGDLVGIDTEPLMC